jgi:hypothetical protein
VSCKVRSLTHMIQNRSTVADSRLTGHPNGFEADRRQCDLWLLEWFPYTTAIALETEAGRRH